MSQLLPRNSLKNVLSKYINKKLDLTKGCLMVWDFIRYYLINNI